jgi:NitT/TauT family transport system substrate-binding protein
MRTTCLCKQAVGAIVAFVLLLQGCGYSESLQDQLEPVTVKVLVQPYLSYAPFFIAQDEGFFAEQALQVEFVQMSEAIEAVPALTQGTLDVAAGLIWPSHLNAMARGAHIRIVADKGHIGRRDCSYTSIMVRPALVETGELEDPARLKNRRIVLNPASFTGYYLDTLLDGAGLSLEDIEIADVPVPARPEALENGAVDGVIVSEPWVTRILQGGQGVIWMPAQQVIPDSQVGSIFYGPSLLDSDSDVGERFMIAYLKAIRQYNRGKTERNLEIMAEYTKLDQELLMQACWPALHDDGRINTQAVLDFQGWAVSRNLLDTSVSEEQFWEPSFIEHANDALGALTE